MHCLVRYGRIPEVARCGASAVPGLHRGMQVVVQTHRGLQLGSIVDLLRSPAPSSRPAEPDETLNAFRVLRTATPADHAQHRELEVAAGDEFAVWNRRIAAWKIDVQLVDLEWTLDRSKLVLYVLNERGPECTKLAIQAAAAGLGIVEVQPVNREGLVSQPSGGGCGNCGCDH